MEVIIRFEKVTSLPFQNSGNILVDEFLIVFLKLLNVWQILAFCIQIKIAENL